MNVASPQFFSANLLALLLSVNSAALAQSEPTALVNQQHCMFCHTRDAPFLGPSFQQIAERYRNVRGAQVMLEHKLRVGGQAHWGDTAMPLPPDRGGPLTRQDARVLIRWVLSQ